MSTYPPGGDLVDASFLMEALELLQAIEQDLLSLKEDRSLNKVHNLMRTTHTLKGTAASVGLETLKQVAHSLEDVFKALYNPSVEIDLEIEELLFQVYECLRLPLTIELTHATMIESEVLNRAAAVFTQLQEKLGDKSCQNVQLPTAADLGVDITYSIFETDVSQRLAALAATLVQPEIKQVKTMLRSSATVFLGLAESLKLPGFEAIASTTLAALDAHPDRAITIAQIALQDWQQGQRLVLAGDRKSGGEPSATLLQLAGEGACELLWGRGDKGDKEDLGELGAPTAVGIRGQKGDLELLSRGDNYELTLHPSSSPAPTISVDLEKLERLNYLTADLLTNQAQQDAANQQLQAKVQKLQAQLQQHQQTLSHLGNWTNQLQFPIPQGQKMVSDKELSSLMHSACEEILRLAQATGEVALFNQECSQTLEKQQQLLGEVRQDLSSARMSPLGVVFNRLERVLLQLVGVYGKPAQLHLSGTHILVDKAIAQKLYDILLHLVRNAFAHGIEPPEARRQLGKPEIGQIRIHAYQREKSIVIEVSDDGKGLDWSKIIERAIEMNLLTLEQAFNLSEEKLLDLLFEPGFSTAAQVNALSGRGLGLDVVRSQLQRMQGALAVQSQPQQGTIFTLHIPQWACAELVRRLKPRHAPNSLQTDSSAIIPTQLPVVSAPKIKTDQFFVWHTGCNIFVLPYTSIEEYLVPQPDQLIQIQQQRFLYWREQMILLYQLSTLLQYNYPLPNANFGEAENETAFILVINLNQRIFAIESALTRLVTDSEIAIEPLARAIAPASYTYGCTVLDNNRLLLVIDAAKLLAQHICWRPGI